MRNEYRINWKHLLFYLTLMDITYPNKQVINDYRNDLLMNSKDGYEVSLEDFIKVFRIILQIKCWFDTECPKDGKKRKEFIHLLISSFDVILKIVSRKL